MTPCVPYLYRNMITLESDWFESRATLSSQTTTQCFSVTTDQPTLALHLNHPGLTSSKDSSHFDNLQLKVRENPPTEYHLKEVEPVMDHHIPEAVWGHKLRNLRSFLNHTPPHTLQKVTCAHTSPTFFFLCYHVHVYTNHTYVKAQPISYLNYLHMTYIYMCVCVYISMWSSTWSTGQTMAIHLFRLQASGQTGRLR